MVSGSLAGRTLLIGAAASAVGLCSGLPGKSLLSMTLIACLVASLVLHSWWFCVNRIICMLGVWSFAPI
jgi:hypothetical protein